VIPADSGSTWGGRRLWAGLVGLGVLARLVLWWASIGSNDADIWFFHAITVLERGLRGAYQTVEAFNHPPLVGKYVARVYLFTGGYNLWDFARLLKLPGLLGEGLTLALLWRFASPRAAAAYALLPAAILVTAFHGSTDGLMAAFVLGAAIAFGRERYGLAGLLFAASLNVKVMPLVLLPMLLVAAPTWRALVRVSLGLAAGLVTFVPPALTVGREMYRNMLDYVPPPTHWGAPLLLTWAAPARSWYVENGRYVIVLAVVAVAVASRFRWHLPLAGQFTVGASMFLVLTPGMGVQYVALVLPLLCLVDLGAGIRWGITAGLFILSVYVYFVVGWWPLRSTISGGFPPLAVAFGLAAWIVLVDFLLRYLLRADREVAGTPKPVGAVQP
jgi:hypothetical protein